MMWKLAIRPELTAAFEDYVANVFGSDAERAANAAKYEMICAAQRAREEAGVDEEDREGEAPVVEHRARVCVCVCVCSKYADFTCRSASGAARNGRKTFITAHIASHNHTFDLYRRSWTEKNATFDGRPAAFDHFGEHGHKTRINGETGLRWTFSGMNWGTSTRLHANVWRR
jgi:hypothetical protein